MLPRFSCRNVPVLALAMVVFAAFAMPGMAGTRLAADEEGAEGSEAEGEAATDLSGTWRRIQPASGDEAADEEPAPRYYVLDDDGSEVLGWLLEESLDSFTRYEIQLRRTADGKLEGTASWQDSYEEAGKSYTFSTETRWELWLESPDLLKGRMEYVDWDLASDPNVLIGEEIERGWTDYEFRRLLRID